jgi:molybdopterin molybdotransferase
MSLLYPNWYNQGATQVTGSPELHIKDLEGGNRVMLPLADAYRLMDDALGGIQRVEHETIPVSESLGRVLAVDLHSKLDIPPFNKAAMDGYAVTATDERNCYRLVGTIGAGSSSPAELHAGEAMKIMTGAPVPVGTRRVIVVEGAREEHGSVYVLAHDPAANIHWRAQDVSQGELILRAGRTIGAIDLANLISCGWTEVAVFRRIRLALISTGDELVDEPGQLQPGKIFNCNGPLLRGLAAEYGFEVISEATVGDDPEQTAAALKQVVDQADIAVISGGVSVGDFDCVPQAIERLGMTIHFSRLAVKPGKPTTFASGKDRVLLGLPGNPVAVYLMFHLFVMRAAGYFLGIKRGLRSVRVKLAADFQRPPGTRLEFIPCRLNVDGRAEPLPYHGSAHLAALTGADGLVAIPPEAAEVHAESELEFLPLNVRWLDD